MIDFHTHILPAMDDGAKTVYESIEMLVAERKQGIGHVFLTPHFYAGEETPSSFLQRRDASFRTLADSLAGNERVRNYMPKLYLGAEVYYFPGISDCEEITQLALADTGCILIEPPMNPWSESMLDEIEAIGTNFSLVPVVVHVDRYCRLLKDFSLFDRLAQRRILNQVNASFFLHEDSKDFAASLLENDGIHLMGSDCHNAGSRKPNLGIACQQMANEGHATSLNSAIRKMYRLIDA